MGVTFQTRLVFLVSPVVEGRIRLLCWLLACVCVTWSLQVREVNHCWNEDIVIYLYITLCLLWSSDLEGLLLQVICCCGAGQARLLHVLCCNLNHWLMNTKFGWVITLISRWIRVIVYCKWYIYCKDVSSRYIHFTRISVSNSCWMLVSKGHIWFNSQLFEYTKPSSFDATAPVTARLWNV